MESFRMLWRKNHLKQSDCFKSPVFQWALILLLFGSTYFFTGNYQVCEDEDASLEQNVPTGLLKPVVAIVVSVCHQNIPESVNLLKSAAFFSREVQLKILIFVDSPRTSTTISKKLDDIGGSAQNLGLNNSIEYEVRVPKDTKPGTDEAICPSYKLQLPSLLPDVDAVIALEPDLLFLGSLRDLWEHFAYMGDKQLAGLVAESEPKAKKGSRYNSNASVPYYGAHGLNAGVMLMNLTRMRRIGFENHVKLIRNGFAHRMQEGDQDILNVLFSFFPEYLRVLPCEFNYRVNHCECRNAMTCNCESAEKYGVTVLHGNKEEQEFGGEKSINFTRDIFEAFDQFKLGVENPRTFMDRLQEKYNKLGIKNDTCYNPALEKNIYAKFLRYISTHNE